MRSLRTLPFAALFLTLALTPSVAGPQAQEKKQPNVALDLYGDPLPEGAVGRLGTIRWRHATSINEAFFAGDDKTIVSAGALGFTVGIWDAATGRLRHKVLGHNVCFHLAVSPDGKTIVTDRLNLIDVKTGQEIRRLAPPPNDITLVAFSPDGKLVAAAPFFFVKPAEVMLWDAETGKELPSIEGHANGIYSMAFSADSKTIATADCDATIRFWDVASGKLTRQLDKSRSEIIWIGFSPDGQFFGSLNREGLTLWDQAAEKVIRELKVAEGTWGIAAFSPDGKLLATCDSSSKIRLWDPRTGVELRNWPGEAGPLSFSPDGKTLAGASGGNTIRRWNVATGKEIDPPWGHTAKVVSIDFAPDGRSLISRGYEYSIVEWDLTSFRERGVVFDESKFPSGKDWSWQVADHTPDGKVVAILGWPIVEPGAKEESKPEDVIRIWNTAQGKETSVLAGPSMHPAKILLSPNGRFLASRGKDGIRLWSVETGKQLQHWAGQTGLMAFTPDSKELVIINSGNEIQLWDLAWLKQIRSWPIKQEKHTLLSFSSSGNRLATRSGTAAIWAADTGQEIRRIGRSSLSTRIDACALSANGRLIALAESERRKLPNDDYQQIASIRVVDVASGEEVRKIDVPESGLYSLNFSPDGRTLAGGCGDSTILLWDLTGYGIPGQFGKYKEPSPLSDEYLQVLWIVLASDAAKAEKALWTLAFSPKQSMPLLKERLQVTTAPADEIAKLLAALEGPTFAERQKAVAALDKLGDSAEAAVRKHIKGQISPEAKQRLQQFLEKRDKEVIRRVRAIEVAEQIGTPEARRLLEVLTKESPNPRVSEAAAVAARRLESQVKQR